MFPKDCDRMSWDILMVSCAAASVTAEEVETWMGLGILPLQNSLFLEGNWWLQHEWRRGRVLPLCRGTGKFIGTGATDDCRGFPATPSSQAHAGTWAPIRVISCSQSN